MPIEEIGYLTEGMRFEALDICGVDMDEWA